MPAQRAKLKLRRSDMTIAQGKRWCPSGRTERHPGYTRPKEFSLSPSRSAGSGERDQGRGVSQFDRLPIAVLNYSMPETNQSRQPTPGARLSCISALLAPRGRAGR
jgi:hypothetical protein